MPRGRRTSLVIQLTPQERSVLESWQRSPSVRAGLVRRGRIILMLADGFSISDISRTVGIRRRFIYKWAYRFLEERLTGLSDRPSRRQTSQDPENPID